MVKHHCIVIYVYITWLSLKRIVLKLEDMFRLWCSFFLLSQHWLASNADICIGFCCSSARKEQWVYSSWLLWWSQSDEEGCECSISYLCINHLLTFDFCVKICWRRWLQFCDGVGIARLLNATLVLPKFEVAAYWNESRWDMIPFGWITSMSKLFFFHLYVWICLSMSDQSAIVGCNYWNSAFW